ncbi:hypothetical protein JVU11DRAFT_5273 [Chiua virens]|nr:hypothetical protein JVU11DRAFT_5273 [Chiua virens]
MPGIAEIRRMNDLLSDHPSFGQESLFHVYPLHSTLSSESQNAVFDVPPAGMRKIVIGTRLPPCRASCFDRLPLLQPQILQRPASRFRTSLALSTRENTER